MIIGPAQAQALQQQLKDWLAGLLGPAVKLPEPPWRITGEHDHYVITWPIPGLTSPAGEVATTANVRPLDGGRWSIDAMKMPPSGTFTMTIPNAGDDGKDAPMDMQFSIGRQDTHGVIDPGFASASTLHTEFGDLVVSSTGAQQRQEQRFDRYVADTSLTPTQNGRLDLTMDATVGRLEIRLGDQRRYADSDRHRDLARERPDQRREPRARRGTAGGGRRPVRRAAPRHRDEAGQIRSARPRQGAVAPVGRARCRTC